MFNYLIEIGMRNYLLVFNGAAVADYFTRSRALKGFKRWCGRKSWCDTLVLFDLNSGETIASSL